MGTCNDCRHIYIYLVGDTMETRGICYNEKIEDKLIFKNRTNCPYWGNKYEMEDE